MRVVKWEDIIYALELNLETNEAAGVVLGLLDYQFNIVRCKECVHNGEYTDCPLNGYAKTDDSYCSYGEREESE